MMADLSRYFGREELECPCCHVCTVSRRLLSLLDRVREGWGSPIAVNSGYRCPTHNREVGGVGNSWHTQGLAADLRPLEGSSDDLHAFVLREFYAGRLPLLGGLGWYPRRIHVDVAKASDGHLRRWRGK